MDYQLQITTPPNITGDTAALTDLKTWLRVDSDDTTQDSEIVGLISAANDLICRTYNLSLWTTGLTLYLDTWLGISLIRFYQQFSFFATNGTPLVLPQFLGSSGLLYPGFFIWVPRPPLVSITEIQYTDPNQTLQTLSPSAYYIDAAHYPARLLPAYGTFFPSTLPIVNAISIEYQSGFGTWANLPGAIQQAIRMLVGGWYENREYVQPGTISEIPFAVGALLAAWDVCQYS